MISNKLKYYKYGIYYGLLDAKILAEDNHISWVLFKG